MLRGRRRFFVSLRKQDHTEKKHESDDLGRDLHKYLHNSDWPEFLVAERIACLFNNDDEKRPLCDPLAVTKKNLADNSP